MNTGHIYSDDARIFYRIMGRGIPLIMLHGNGENHRIFKEQARYLSRHYQVILMDSRGHGRSQFGSKTLTIDQMAADVH